MAYGDKFVLRFKDVKGHYKQLTIAQDGYTGDKKEVIGSGDPVYLIYEQDDNFYNPIMGSTCQLNLMQMPFSENLILRSTALNVSPWQNSTTTVSISNDDPPFWHPNRRTGSDTEESELLTSAPVTGSRLYQNVSLETSTIYCASVYVKNDTLVGVHASVGMNSNETGFFGVSYKFTTGELITYGTHTILRKGVKDVGGGWYRIYVSAQMDATSVTNESMEVNRNVQEGTQKADYWGAMLNVGEFPDRWIFTSSTTQNNQLDDFVQSDEREYKVKLEYGDQFSLSTTLWEGFITADDYIERFQTEPFEVNLTASDGLGELDAFRFDFSEMEETLSGGGQYSIIQRIAQALKKTGLEFPIYTSVDVTSNGRTENVFDFDFEGIFTKNLDIITAKDALKNVLMQMNARLFQHESKWLIISNSEYTDKTLLDDQFTTADGGTIPSGVRSTESAYLVTNEFEKPNFRTYTFEGVFSSNISTINVLRIIKDDAKLLNADAIFEFSPPHNKVITTEKLENFYVDHPDLDFKNILTRDAGFEFNETPSIWTVNHGTLDEHDFIAGGNRSYKTTANNTGFYVTRASLSISSNFFYPKMEDADELEFQCQVYIDFSENNDDSITFNGGDFRFKLIRNAQGSGTIEYWNGISWTTNSSNFITLETKQVDQWVTLKEGELPFSTTTNHRYAIQIGSSNLSLTGAGASNPAVYYDNVFIKRVREEKQTRIHERKQANNSSVFEREFQKHIFSKVLFRPRDYTLEDNDPNTVVDIGTQQILNDYRSPMRRFNATLYNLNTDVITPFHKLWINMVDGSNVVYRSAVAMMIDKIEISLKRNESRVFAHEPNQDDDITASIRNTYTT
ncbi:MAG: hypothetical protein CMP95_06520 [Gammaproteobacteria bacterium]|nr:hypothetical protein [Gammaproteobacteria bacterium]